MEFCRISSQAPLLITLISLAILSTAIPSCQGRWKNSQRSPQQERSAVANYSMRSMELNAITEASAGGGGHHMLRNELFSTINRRQLASCSSSQPYVSLSVSANGGLADVQNVTVTVSGVEDPSDKDWIGVVTPSTADIDDCVSNSVLYIETGDTAAQPLLCHYPVKYLYMYSDPQYTSCGISTCQRTLLGKCLTKTCSGSVTFRLINIRTNISFVLFSGGVALPCVVNQSAALSFANPSSPLYGHLSSVDSTGTQMRLTWVSGDSIPQQVNYTGVSAISTVSTFTPANMTSNHTGAATDFGWHDPGYIHTAVMTGLTPSTPYSYSYGSAAAGWSTTTNFTTPPAMGDSSVNLVIYGDMGKAERDNSSEHYVNPGSVGVIDLLTERNDVDLVLHIGDISYATGFMVEWDEFLELITPVAGKVSYMTAIGNHEMDWPDTAAIYTGHDSGGEIGVPYEAYFPMPTAVATSPWYSFASGPVHFTVMSTEHNWTSGSEQYAWIQADLAAVNRTITPWIIFTGHRPAYSSYTDIINLITPAVDSDFPPEIEPLLLNAKVDFAVWGHVHNYERTCQVYNDTCLGSPTKDAAGFDTYNNTVYTAPVHVVIGTAGFTLDDTYNGTSPPAWSLVRIKDYGYSYLTVTLTSLVFQFISSTTGLVSDQWSITR